MDFKVDNAYILYGAGVFLGIISVLYFGLEIILSFSPVTKSLLLLSGSVIFFSSALYISNKVLDKTLYLLSATSYVVFLGYTLAKFSFGSELTFLALAASSALFIGLGYLVSEEKLDLEKEKIKRFLGVVGILVAGLIVFDVVGAEVQQDLLLEEKVTVSEREDAQIGVLKVQNDFVLHREFELKDYDACLYRSGEKENAYVRYENNRDDLIAGMSSREVPLKLSGIPIGHETNKTFEGEYSVEKRESCPESLETNTIVVVEEGDRRPR